MIMAVVLTEWTLVCALATTWAWLYHGRYHAGIIQIRTRARRAPMSNSLLDSKASLMRFMMIPAGIILVPISVQSWLNVFRGVHDNSPAGSLSTLLVSSAVLTGYLVMAGYEVYLLRSGRRMPRPRASGGASAHPTASRAAARPRRQTAKRGSG